MICYQTAEFADVLNCNSSSSNLRQYTNVAVCTLGVNNKIPSRRHADVLFSLLNLSCTIYLVPVDNKSNVHQ